MKHKLLVSLISILISIPALAKKTSDLKEDEMQLQSSYFYLGGRLGSGYFQGMCDSNSEACHDYSFGGGIYAGYQFKDWFALEGSVTDYGKPHVRYAIGSVSADMYSMELSTKLSYHLSSEWTLFSRIGAAYQHIEKQSDWKDGQINQDWNTLVTIGVDYRLSQRWSLRGEYQFIDGISDDVFFQSDLLFTSLGLTYYFGQENHPTIAIPSPEFTSLSKSESTPILTKPVVLDGKVLFNFDSSELIYNTDLEALAVKLTKYSQGNIYIVGYTDSSGSLSYNRLLSKQRAQAVAEYFKHMGISESRLIIEGKGENAPVAINSTKEGRAQNRRVNIHFEILKSW